MAGLCFLLLNLLITLHVGTVITTLQRSNFNNLSRFFKETPFDVSVDEGKLVNLECVVISRARHCLWRRDKIYPVQPGITPGYSKIGEQENGYCSMEIKSADLVKDNGLWECIVTLADENKEIKANATVTVLRPPQTLQVFKGNRIISSSMNMPFSEGEDGLERLQANITLQVGQNISELISCVSAGSNPAADIVWIKEYDLIPSFDKIESDSSEENTFTVISYPNFTVSLDYHDAIIRCQRIHQAVDGLKAEVFFRMFVEHPTSIVSVWPKKTIIDPNQTVYEIKVNVGRVEAIECQANGYPVPTFTWVKILGEEEETYGNSTLFVGRSIADEGLYRCLAENILNDKPINSSHDVRVKVEYPTNNVTVQSDQPSRLNEGGEIHLRCQANGFPSPQIRWLKKYPNGWFQIGWGESYIISNFTAVDQGDYYCSANNVHNNEDVVSLPVHLHLQGSSDFYENWAVLNCHPLRPFCIFLINMVLIIYVQLFVNN